MNPDELKQSWQTQTSQTRLTIDADLLYKEVRRNQRWFAAMIFWRNFREVGVAIVLVPIWIYLGLRSSQPWTWYLTVPAMLWIAGFLLGDRLLQKRPSSGLGDPLRQCLESSLAQVEHQIWLLRNVHWWYLLPLSVAILAYFGQVTWQKWTGDWLITIVAGVSLSVIVLVFVGVYWLNQYAVRTEIEPRRMELQAQLARLKDE